MGPLELLPWSIPVEVRREGKESAAYLAFGPRPGRRYPPGLRPPPDYATAKDVGILAAFLKLAGGADPLRFAQRFGPLGLTSGGLPVGLSLHTDGRSRSPAEPVSRYAFYSKVVRGVIQTATAVRQGRAPKESATGPVLELWQELHRRGLERWISERLGMSVGWRRSSSVPLRWGAKLVENTINLWLMAGWTAPAFGWDGAPIIALGHDRTSQERGDGRGRRGRPFRTTTTFVPAGAIRAPHSGAAFGIRAGRAWGAVGVRLAEKVHQIVEGPICAYCGRSFEAPSLRRGRPCCGRDECDREADATRQRAGRARDNAARGAGYRGAMLGG